MIEIPCGGPDTAPLNRSPPLSPTDSAAEDLGLLQQAFAAHRRADLGEAERLYRAVLAESPAEARALANLGALYMQQSRAEAALEALDAALATRPEQPDVLGNRAGALRALGRRREALDSVQRAIALKPDYADGLNTLGLLLTELGRPDEALPPLERALALAPDHPVMWNNLGLALSQLSRPEEALASFERALTLAPGFLDALSNRAAALRALGRLEEALLAGDQLLAAEPRRVDALVNRGCVLRDLGRPAEALAIFEQACALDPQHVEAHWSLALELLSAGRWAEGWPLFEWRWRRPQLLPQAARFDQPPWLGEEPLAGKTLLLHYEQGLGDSLQMLRYAPFAAAQGASVILAVQPALLTLAGSVAGVAQVVTDGDPLPAFDLHCPLMSLPLAFATTPDTVPWAGPYLAPPPRINATWRGRLERPTRPRIGLVWSGNPRQLNDRNRSLSLDALTPLLDADAEFISLQKDYRPGDRERLDSLGIADWSDALHDLAETAGLVAQLDAVAAVDTSVAHLAGAMGKPVLVLLSFAASDFRWGEKGERTPWYPSARLLRQTAPQDWTAPICQAAAMIAAL
jgi:tetratricopeptide (TPR) repeat protein